jgi:hypothetical protein
MSGMSLNGEGPVFNLFRTPSHKHDYFCSSSSESLLRLELIHLLILLGSFDSKFEYIIRAFYLWYGLFWDKMLT